MNFGLADLDDVITIKLKQNSKVWPDLPSFKRTRIFENADLVESNHKLGI
jgi:hypothetical protein